MQGTQRLPKGPLYEQQHWKWEALLEAQESPSGVLPSRSCQPESSQIGPQAMDVANLLGLLIFLFPESLKSMKRLRSDVIDTPPFKRPICSSHGESNIDPGAALSYVREIKGTFVDQVEKYDMFLDVMKDLKARRIDPVGVIERVRELFKGHPSLLLGFNAFVPNGYKIMLNDEDKASSKKTTNYEEERNLVENIKKCFGNDQEFKLFVDIMMMYKKESKDINEVYHEVAVLFNAHPDLLDEFTEFLKDSVTPNPLCSLLLVLNPLLPCGYDLILNNEVKPPLKKSIHFEQVFSFVNKIKKHLVNNHEYKSFLDIMNKCRKERNDVKEVYNEVAVLLNDRPDLLDEFSGFLPDSVTTNMLSNLDDDKKSMK
ncbi:hypothetical protein KY290_004412 [Solanum tuberosum]|uniref:Paired amphipathic helix protein Sin3-like 2 n=1 Tax=Solanum tuberosum TaxID=4113 RepID=A0ABQ7WXU8_SOLTU|nr:hypothetical protein KY285_004320 [Solanum tuberosum]KAH0784814.1 hypothetical protein KY290_004412 [Solanum tuberosum]